MGESKSTPGPWKYSFNRALYSEGSVFTENGLYRIAIVCGSNWGELRHSDDGGLGEFEANARLIAAAPEMFPITQAVAALHIADDARDDFPVFGTNGNYITAGDVRRARAAIAKAEGRT